MFTSRHKKYCSVGTFTYLVDEDFDKLSTTFLSTGRGRRPTLPQMKTTCSCRLLLQLYYCKNDKSWEELTGFAQKFISLSKERLRNVIETTFKRACKLIDGDEQHFTLFLEEELLFIGNRLQSAGLTREQLLNVPTPVPLPIVLTNGILIELDKFRKDETFPSSWLHEAVEALTCKNQCDRKTLTKDFTKIVCEYKKKSRNQSKDRCQLEAFLLLDYVCSKQSSVNSDVCHMQETPNNPKKRFRENSEISCDTPHKAVQLRKLKGSLESLEKTLTAEKTTGHTLQQLVTEKNLQIASLTEKKDDEICELLESKLKIQASLAETKGQLTELKCSLQHHVDTLSKLRQTAYYKRLKRKECKLQNDKLNFQKQVNDKVRDAKKSTKMKIRSLQSQLSNATVQLKLERKEKRTLKKKVKDLKSELVNIQEQQQEFKNLHTKEFGNKFTKDVVKCTISLIGDTEVSAKNCGKAMQIVCKNLFGIQLTDTDLPSERSSLRFADQGHILAKHQVAESLLKSTNADLHSDGTSKDHNKYVGHQLTTDSGQSLSCGFIPVCQENTSTLVDIAFGLLQELAELYDSEDADEIFKSMLKNLSGLMSDRASVMKSFNKAFSEKRKTIIGTDEEMEFLHCNAHFLLGLSSAADKVIKEWEDSKENAIGRNASSKFLTWASTGENSAGRYIRTGCDILGPRGDEKNGCRDSWDAFCQLKDITSTITSFKGNRFNNYFQSAASLHFHRADIINFLENFLSPLNRKQDSVLLDAKCDTLDCAIIALGLIYKKVTGPYWILMGKEVKYLNFFNHVCELHTSLSQWSDDPTPLTNDEIPPLFGLTVISDVLPLQFKLADEKKTEVHSILQKLCSTFKNVTERQLSDFLPGGRYHNVRCKEMQKKMQHSKITNLLGEACFGDLDFSIFKRRNSSLHHHSTVNMLKRNKTSAWFSAKSELDQKLLLTTAARKSEEMRAKHREVQKQVVERRKEIICENKRAKEAKAEQDIQKRKAIMSAVKQNGGPCLTIQDLKSILATLSSQKLKTDAVKNEIRYQKIILGIKNKSLKLTGNYQTLLNGLNTFLGSNSSSTEVTYEDHDDECTDDEVEETVIESTDTAAFGDFQFTKQGQNVAVYFDNDFYVGQVVNVRSLDEADVKFLDKCGLKNNVFRWPRQESIEIISSVYVFDWDFDLFTTNGRMWTLSSEIYHQLENKYKCYKEIYC